ncbi:hypothetical protein EV356DRAFT_531734 [Viridothelium virens]|uniref:Uncharacterized protein n=1 Tax=Viridothelium virens TaxID=1048519 RepID=A0A6A6HC41_VIRVR|nr:hypothetical protein EV356DRAFT_531734 [Viridothelium virens]
MLSPITGPPDRSIWKRVSRASFEASIEQLHLVKPVPKTREYPTNDPSVPQNGYLLPFDVERQLADDFAYLAAYNMGVGFVSAATVCLNSEPPSLTVCIAANEGLALDVKTALEEILSKLEKCAKKELRRKECAATIFDSIVELHLEKILVRLGIRRAEHENDPPRGNLMLRVENLLKHFGSAKKSSSIVLNELLGQLNSMKSLFDRVNIEVPYESLDTIQAVIMEAFAITSKAKDNSFDSMLLEVGIPESDLDCRAIRDLKKLANYWRICDFLSEMCRSYRPCFSVIHLKTLDHFRPLRSILSSANLFVHAEVQILSYYESTHPKPWPRAIGASKEACFLCDAFIEAHGCFRISKAHRHVYPLWTIPDLIDYNSGAVRRLSEAIFQTKLKIDEELKVEKALKARRWPRQWRPWPLQSSVNLLYPHLPVGSVTSRSSVSKRAPSTASPRSSLSEASTSTLKIVEEEENQPDTSNQMPVAAKTPLEITLDRLTLYVHFEDFHPPGEGLAEFGERHGHSCGHFTSGSISIDHAEDLVEPAGESVDLSNLQYGKDHLLSVPVNERTQTLRFALINGKEAPVYVTCKWHR